MQYFATSLDILFIVLALSIIWVTVLVSVLLFQAISIVRSVKGVMISIQDRILAVDALLDKIRDKLDATQTHLSLLVDVAREGISYFGKKTVTKKKKTTKKK